MLSRRASPFHPPRLQTEPPQFFNRLLVSKSLPIWQVAPAILESLRTGNRLVLAAPTGSGKSTQVPQMLVDELGLKRVVVLQPRRVAARTLAARVASERGAKLGGEVGYQIRFEDYTSRGTKISFVTEGILLRWLQDDPTLAGIDAVIFDEFHERNLLSDVALGLVKRLQQGSAGSQNNTRDEAVSVPNAASNVGPLILTFACAKRGRGRTALQNLADFEGCS